MSESKVLGIVFSNMHDDRMGDLTMVRTMGGTAWWTSPFPIWSTPVSGTWA